MTSSIKLGVLAPFTGIVGMYGEEIARAAHLACDEINEAGGLAGRSLELVIADDCSDPEHAVQTAKHLIDLGCVALVGNLLSNVRLAVAYRVAELERVPLLNFSFYEGSIQSRYFFHFAALPNQQIECMIAAICRRHGPRMFLAGNAYEWPRGSIAAAMRALDRCGGEQVGERYLPLGAAAHDLDALIDEIAASEADVLVPYFAGHEQLAFLRRVHARGLAARSVVVMGHFDERMAAMLEPEVREGLYACNTYFMSLAGHANQRMLDRLARHPGVEGVWPRGTGIVTHFGEGAYVCVKAFAQAVERAGERGEALRRGLADVELRAPQGLVRMAADTQHATLGCRLARCTREGVLEIVETFEPRPAELPERYRQRAGTRTGYEDEARTQAVLLAHLSEAVMLVRADDGVILYSNPAAERLLGGGERPLVGRSFVSRRGELAMTRRLDAPAIVHALEHASHWHEDLELQRGDGSGVTCEVRGSAFTHPLHGEVWCFECHDVGEQRRTEQALRESEARYRRAEAGTNDGLWEWNMQTGESYHSPRWSAILGYAPGELSDRYATFESLVHPEDMPRLDAARTRHELEGAAFDVEIRMLHRDGEYRWIRSRGQVTRDECGARMTGSISDVTEQREAEARLRQAYRLAGLGAWEYDFVRDRVWWSEEVYRIHGIPHTAPIRQDGFRELVYPDDREAFDRVYQRVLDEGNAETTFRILRPDGQVRHVHSLATLLRDARGRPLRMYGTNCDVTEAVEAAQAQRRSLAEKDALLREIHHRVKNNLAIVSSLLHFHARMLASPDDADTLVKLCRRIQAMSLAHDHLYRARDVGRVVLGEYIEALVSELRQTPRGECNIEVVADPVEVTLETAMPLGQVVSELVANALAHSGAKPSGEPVRVGVAIRRTESELEICVEDEGPGLPEGFNPECDGSFGWLLVRSLAKQIGARVEVTRSAGACVCLRLSLPPAVG